MKLLFDQNISFRIINYLPEEFLGSKQVSHVGLNNCDDIDIWQFAHDNNFAIVTYDSDFYDISLINGCPPKIIWLRTGNLTTNEIARVLGSRVNEIYDFINNPELTDFACLEIE